MRKQSGFSLVEGLLVLIIVGLLGFVGWYVYDSNNKANKNLDNADKSNSVTTKSADPTANWKTYVGDPTKNPLTVSGEGDGIEYSFKYPSDWSYYPIGTAVKHDGQESANSFQEIVPRGKTASDGGLTFKSEETTLDAKAAYEKEVGDQSGLVGPTWEGVKAFTTKKGYSAYTAKLDNGQVTVYSTLISNKKGLVTFGYSSVDSKYFNIYNQIFDTVEIP